MDSVKPKTFGSLADGESLLNGVDKETKPKDLREAAGGEVLPKKRKTRHKKFIDLQKQPPKPKPLVQE